MEMGFNHIAKHQRITLARANVYGFLWLYFIFVCSWPPPDIPRRYFLIMGFGGNVAMLIMLPSFSLSLS